MNFLVIEGYQDVAAAFQRETDIKPDVSLDSIDERMAIRKAVQSGDVTAAIERVNELNPQILNTNAQLSLHLQQQRLIELIRADQLDAALSFAQTELAPRTVSSPEFLTEMERIMSLLAFPTTEHSKSPSATLLGMDQRQRVANELNEAILRSQGQHKEPRLSTAAKRLVYEQERLGRELDFPQLLVTDLLTGTLQATVAEVSPATPATPAHSAASSASSSIPSSPSSLSSSGSSSSSVLASMAASMAAAVAQAQAHAAAAASGLEASAMDEEKDEEEDEEEEDE